MKVPFIKHGGMKGTFIKDGAHQGRRRGSARRPAPRQPADRKAPARPP
jgi:hypothetical protein